MSRMSDLPPADRTPADSGSSALPPPLRDYLAAVVARTFQPAYLRVARDGRLLVAGGALEKYGLADVPAGRLVTERAVFLDGLLPVTGEPLVLPYVQVAPGVFAEVHVVPR